MLKSLSDFTSACVCRKEEEPGPSAPHQHLPSLRYSDSFGSTPAGDEAQASLGASSPAEALMAALAVL